MPENMSENQKTDRESPTKENVNKGVIEDITFEALEKDFQDVLNELHGDRSLEKFRIEYEKLHRALRKSHESEKRLMSKCRELNGEIVGNAAKVSTALQLSQEDQSTIAQLKKEIEKAWKMVDASHDKEQSARETIQTLKLEIANLTKLVEQGAGLTLGQEHSVNELLKAKEELSRDRDGQLAEIAKLREKLTDAYNTQKKVEQDRVDAENKIAELSQDIQVRHNEAQRESRRKEKLDKEMKQANSELDKKSADIKGMQVQSQRYKDEIGRLETQYKEQRIQLERTLRDMEVMNQRYTKIHQDYEQQVITCDGLTQDNALKHADVKAKEDEISKLKSDTVNLNKVQAALQRKLRTVEDQKVETEHQKITMKSQIIALEREIDANTKQVELDRKAIEDLVRERDILNKNLLKAANATHKQLNLVKLHEQSRRNLEQEMQNYSDEGAKQRKIIYQLEKERDRYINESSDLTQRVFKHLEDIKVRELEIFDYKKKVAEAESKLKQQQNLYEGVRSDRNLYSKNLIESQDEITEMKRKLKIMNHQVDQLKEEINSKEAALVKEHLDHQRVEKEKEGLKGELQRMKQQAAESKAYIDAQEAEERKLLKIISEADAERLRQQKELDQVISERDILGTQLVRRNDELALLYEKIKIQHSILSKGEMQYRQRLEDVRLLKLEIKKLRVEKNVLNKSVSNVDDLRREVHHLQRELLRERTRCKALEEELENPMNIHRWRKLEGSDPSTFELIQKTQTLQKRLIKKTEQVIAKEVLIQEKDTLYMELKHILARPPGPEVAEQVRIYKQTLKSKTKQLKAMVAELNMYESQVQEYKYEIERLAKELQDVKKKYYSQRRKDQQARERDRVGPGGSAPLQPQLKDGPRVSGGGFKFLKNIEEK